VARESTGPGGESPRAGCMMTVRQRSEFAALGPRQKRPDGALDYGFTLTTRANDTWLLMPSLPTFIAVKL
jgi:hypothetical protein